MSGRSRSIVVVLVAFAAGLIAGIWLPRRSTGFSKAATAAHGAQDGPARPAPSPTPRHPRRSTLIPSPPETPSILLVTLDTLNKFHLGYFGYHRTTSPRLDALLRSSRLFVDATTASPWTVPSVASIMTGVPYSIHDAGHRRTRTSYEYTAIGSDISTLAEVLRERGFMTVAITSNPYFDPEMGLGFARGFDHVVCFKDKGSDDAVTARVATLRGTALPETLCFDTGGDAADITLAVESVTPGLPTTGLFLWVHFFDTHNPFVQRGAYIQSAGWDAETGRPEGFRWMDYDVRNAQRAGLGELTIDERQAVVAAYDGEIAFLDTHVDRVVSSFLGHTEGDGRYLITTDHGEEIWERGAVDHGHSYFQEVISSFIALGGGTISPAIVTTPVGHTDVFATICDMAGITDTPNRLDRPLPQRYSLLDDPPPHDRSLLCENNIFFERQIAVRLDSRKLLIELLSARSTMFDLAADPGENRPEDGTELAKRLEPMIMALSAARGSSSSVVEIDEETEANLKALGYLR